MRIFCSICKEILIPYSEIKVTNCGHVYHGSCISRWYKQHKTCPHCRTNIEFKPFRVYFDVEKDNDTDASTLEHQIETLTDKLRENEITNKNLREVVETHERAMVGMEKRAADLKREKDTLKTSVKALKEQVTNMSKQNERVSCLKEELKEWKNKVATMERIENLIKGSVDEVNKMMESTPVTQLAVRQLCTYVGILKVQLHKNETKRTALIKENKDLMRALADEKKKNSNDSEEALNNMKSTYCALERELYGMKKLLKEYAKKQVDSGVNTSSHDKTQALVRKQPVFDVDLDKILDSAEEKNDEKVSNAEISKTISQWEDIICAGPSKNFGTSLGKSKSLRMSFYKEPKGKELQGSSSNYAFDGLGGRKKIRLGSPTVQDEFEKIKKSEERQTATSYKHKKIIDFYQFK